MAGIHIACDCVKGKSHSACEDSAHAQMLETGAESGIVLFAVADGHGSAACVRSARGSELAVQVAINWLERLAKSFGADQDQWGTRLLKDAQERMAAPRTAYGPGNARGRTDAPSYPVGASDSACDTFAKSLVGDWRRAVIADADPQTNPLTEAELQAVHDSGYRWDESHLFRLYGTTLIAGALLPDAVFLLQQGDGCCCVLFEGGEAQNPMPEDGRCVGNVTTSMCDDDAARAMRFACVDRRRHDPIACFVATDGVDKSVSGEGGVENFFRGVVLDTVSSQGEEVARATLHETLELLSSQGARDDTSIAGFIDVERASRATDALAARRQRFDQELEIRMLEERQLSLTRGVDRYRSAEAECERFRPWVEEHEQNQRRIDELRGLASAGAHADAAALAQEGAAMPESERQASFDGRTRPGAANPERMASPSVVEAGHEVSRSASIPDTSSPLQSGQEFYAPSPQGMQASPVPAASATKRSVLPIIGAAIGAAAVVACIFMVFLARWESAPSDAVSPDASAGPTALAEPSDDQLNVVKDALRAQVDKMLRSKTLVADMCGEQETANALESAELDDAAQSLACACIWALDDQIDGLSEPSVELQGDKGWVTIEFPSTLTSIRPGDATPRALLRDARKQLEEDTQTGGGIQLRFALRPGLSEDEWRVVSVVSSSASHVSGQDGADDTSARSGLDIESQIGEAIGFKDVCESAVRLSSDAEVANPTETTSPEGTVPS